jgi:4-amino-4-deoxy-L-arabinose transferase-like glycosyltransferase
VQNEVSAQTVGGHGKSPLGTQLSNAWKEALPFALIFAAACWIFFAQLGQFPLFNPDEALYAEPAREMIVTGDWITTQLNYEVRFTKPPLAIWAMAACFQIFGTSEFAARFFGATCGAILVALTYWFARRFISMRAAVFACLCLIGAPLFVAVARQAITDMPLSLFVAGAIMSFYTAKESGSARWRWMGYALTGLAVMTKGPVGLLLPAVPLGIYYVLRGELKEAWKELKPLPGLALVALIALPWFIAEIVITKGAYFYEFIVRENFQRYTSVVDSHDAPIWYHGAAMFGGFMPWTLFLPPACVALYAALKSTGWQLRKLDERVKLLLMCCVWALFTLVFFSASVSKLLPYTLPAFPAMALLVGYSIDKAISFGKRWQILMPFALLSIVYGVMLQIGPLILNRLRDKPEGITEVLLGFAAFELVLSGGCCILAGARRLQAAVLSFAVLSLMAMTHFGLQAVRLVSESWEMPLVAFSRYAGDSCDPIIVYSMRKPGVTFYAERPVLVIKYRDEFLKALETLPRAYILGRKKTWPNPEELPGCDIVDKKGDFFLVRYTRPAAGSAVPN